MRLRRRLQAWLAGPLRWRVRQQRQRFLDSTRECRRSQHEVLQGLLQLNEGTRFSADHGLTPATTVEEFTRQVPVSDYEYHRPYIDDLRRGETSALLGEQNRLLMFSLTSGTTAESKFIPVTTRFLSDYRRGWQVWGITAFDDHPDLHYRKVAQLCSDHEQFRTDAGTPCGNISGLVAAMQKKHVRLLYSIPHVVARIPDAAARRYATLRMAIADREVGQFVTANPSTLLHLATFGNAHASAIIADIEQGTLSSDFEIPGEVRDYLTRRIRGADPERAGELRAAQQRTGSLRPRDIWPHLQLLGIWTGGSAGAFVQTLEPWYGPIPTRDHGLHASEGRMTIPLRDGTPCGALDISSHFFEFIPEEEAEATSPTVLQAHEVEEGRTYFILLTTSSGLYRYNIRDVVRCTGFLNSTPEFEFLHKGAHMSSITGEKISESQVVTAVTSGARQADLRLRHFTLTPQWNTPPRYQLFVDTRDVPDDHAAGRLQEATEAALREVNCEYQDKRDSGRLGGMECVRLPEANWQQFVTARVNRGGSLEQYKHPCLLPDPGFESAFARLAGLPLPDGP